MGHTCLFLAHPAYWNKRVTSNTQNVPPEVDFESSRSPAVSKSWKSHNLNCWTVFPTWQYWLYSLVKWMQEIKRARRLSQALTHFVIARVSLLTVHRISGLPERAKYRHFRTIWEHSFDNFSYEFQHGVETLKSCWVVLFANSQTRSTNFLAWPSMS